jgi:hypothetical protein
LPPDAARLVPDAPAADGVIIRAPGGISAAPSFRDQLHLAAQRLKPSALHFTPAVDPADTSRIS